MARDTTYAPMLTWKNGERNGENGGILSVTV
jgi:hypothetical protein